MRWRIGILEGQSPSLTSGSKALAVPCGCQFEKPHGIAAGGHGDAVVMRDPQAHRHPEKILAMSRDWCTMRWTSTRCSVAFTA